ncbi:MAG TPA: sugar-binding transcriptional regulator [Anaerovoracaceae bacterium]|nr:sugar-binding transcriptional regulator [Anaerovoracaceae bacterium]
MAADRRLLVQISRLYYEENMTQQQIANKLNVSRMSVSRSIQKSKDENIVKISIDYRGTYPDLEERLVRKYGLKEAVIVESVNDKSLKEQVARAAAYYVENCIRPDSTIAVGWGTTIRKVADFVSETSKRNLLFTPIIGGHGKSELEIHATSLAFYLAKKTNSTPLYLLAPAFVNSVAEKELLLKDSYIQAVLRQTSEANYALFSLGCPLTDTTGIQNSGYFSASDLEQLHMEQAVCDLVSILFLNRSGKQCCKSITDRSIGILPEALKKIPVKICVVAGEGKREAVKAAMMENYVDVLVTDHETGTFLSKQ